MINTYGSTNTSGAGGASGAATTGSIGDFSAPNATRGEKKKKKSKAWLYISLLLVSVSLILEALARLIPGFGNYYATTVYPFLQSTLGKVTGYVPLSVSEIFFYLIPIILILDLISIIKSKFRKTGKKRPFAGLFKRIVILVSLLIFLYVANCGVNYYRTSFAETEGFAAVENDQKLLEDFCKFAVEGIIETTGENDDVYLTGMDMRKEAVTAMEQLGKEYKSLSGYYSLPKAILVSRPYSNMGITGIYSPFGIEANYNREITPYNRPYTMCHELSHLKGYMNEGEANFIGWLACLGSDDAGFNRSAYMMAWIYGGNELYKTDKEAYKKLRNHIPESALTEFKENQEFWDKYETKASEIQDQVNNAYLMANDVEGGIKSYGQVLGLMLSWYKDNQ